MFAKEKPADKQPLELPAQSEANIQPNAAQVDDGAAVGLRQFENSLADAKQLMQASPEAAAAVIKQWMAPPLMKDILVEQENNYERDSS